MGLVYEKKIYFENKSGEYKIKLYKYNEVYICYFCEYCEGAIDLFLNIVAAWNIKNRDLAIESAVRAAAQGYEVLSNRGIKIK